MSDTYADQDWDYAQVWFVECKVSGCLWYGHVDLDPEGVFARHWKRDHAPKGKPPHGKDC